MRAIKFHQGFKLDRSRLATLMRCMAENGVITKKTGATYMGVGEPAAEGAMGWLIKAGLGSAQGKGYQLTRLGALLARHDPELVQASTLWLLHYYLITDHSERAEVWYHAFNNFLSPGTSFTRDALQTYVERSLEILPTNKSGVEADCNEFVKCYLETAALARLGLLREVEKRTYETSFNNSPEPHVFAFALFDAWQRRFPHADTLRITQVCTEVELPGKVFAARRDQIVHMLQVLQSMGMVNIVDSQHEPVTRRFRDDPHQLLESHYRNL